MAATAHMVSAKQMQCHTPSLQQAAYAQLLAAQQVQAASQHYATAQMHAQANLSSTQNNAATMLQGPALETLQWNMPQFKQPSYVPPPSLTAGMPDPASVEQQKGQHLQSIAGREKQTLAALEHQRQIHLAAIHEQAEQQRKRMMLLVEQQVQQMVAALEHDFNNQVTQTKQQHNDLRSALEHQAIQLVTEFQQKHLQEVAMNEQAKLDQEKEEANRRYQLEMQKLQHLQHQPAHIMQTPSFVPPVDRQNTNTQLQLDPATQMITPYAASATTHLPTIPSGSYVPPPIDTYTPPATTYVGPARPGSYVPPERFAIAATPSSYVPPVGVPQMQSEVYHAHLPTTGGSYVPPPGAPYPTMISGVFGATTGSYVPPVIMPQMENEVYHVRLPMTGGSYVPPPGATYPTWGSCVAAATLGSDVPPPTGYVM